MDNSNKNTDIENIPKSSEASDAKADEVECCKAILMKANQLQYQLNKLSSKIDGLQLVDQSGFIEESLQNFTRDLDNQVASIKAIQNMQAEEFEQKLLEKDRMRLELLDALNKQEQSHLQETESLKKQLEASDKRCLELEHQVESNKSTIEHNTTCSICFDQWNSSTEHRLVSLGCGHLFGDNCIRDCLRRVSECPQCRARADQGQIRYIYGRPL
ncbi:PREDICTED: E3 ubiquitin-protein ligase RFWD3-like [Drosophila arizonae]|uniref:E3 ubiquitin-protein ligase RFWD3-like n=1 Tax=Drosophila arizonae TaxID=7263 RepID=A0ABM1P0D9_DROAR|nr:PREDICTED: E3 ubiquitin-protein ligase RFWD3-like [Drosophila arizonae]